MKTTCTTNRLCIEVASVFFLTTKGKPRSAMKKKKVYPLMDTQR